MVDPVLGVSNRATPVTASGTDSSASNSFSDTSLDCLANCLLFSESAAKSS